MPAGRPSKYTPELVEKAKEYLVAWPTLDQVIPSIEGLAVHLKLNRDTLYDWAKQEDKEEFSDILGEIKGKQAQILMNKGLTGDFTPTISKLILTKHGYHDKVDQEHSGPGGKPMAISYNVQPVRPVEPKDKDGSND